MFFGGTMSKSLFLIILTNILALSTCLKRDCFYPKEPATTGKKPVDPWDNGNGGKPYVPEEVTTKKEYQIEDPKKGWGPPVQFPVVVPSDKKPKKKQPTEIPETETEEYIITYKEPKKPPSPAEPPKEKPVPIVYPTCAANDGISDLRVSLIEFGSKFVHRLLDDDHKDTAFACSPFTALYMVGILSIYSYGKHQSNELFKALHLKNSDQVRCTFLQLKNYITRGENVYYSVAEGTSTLLYANEPYRFTRTFREDSKKVALVDTFTIDFRNPAEAVNIINRKAQEVTNKKIKTVIFDTDDFEKDTKLVAAEPIYIEFNIPGFNENEVTKDSFRTSKGSVTEYYLTQTGVFNYTYNKRLKAKVLSMDLDSVYKLYLYLPNKKSGLKSVVRRLDDYDFYEKVHNSLKPEAVVLKIPRIEEINTGINLNKYLRSDLHTPDIFHKNIEKLTNVVEKDPKLSVTVARQQVRLRVNYSQTPQPRSKKGKKGSSREIFDANRPFLGTIMAYDIPVVSFVVQR